MCVWEAGGELEVGGGGGGGGRGAYPPYPPGSDCVECEF